VSYCCQCQLDIARTALHRDTLMFCLYSTYLSVCLCVCLKADLQTSSQRLNLSGGSGQPTAAELAADESIDDVIHHEVKELGTHMYVVHCCVCLHVSVRVCGTLLV